MIPQEQFNNFYENLTANIAAEVEKKVLVRLKSTAQEDELLTPEAVAEYLNVHKTTVYQLCKEKRLKHIKIGSIRSKKPAIRVPRSELNAYIQKQLEEAIS